MIHHFHDNLYIYIIYYCLLYAGPQGAGAYPSWQWARGRIHPEQVATSLLQQFVSQIFSMIEMPPGLE